VTASHATPLVSVIVPAFDCADFLADAVGSVRAQGQPDLEIIVVDDGSRDGTPAVIRSLGGGIRSLRQPNQGPASARNAGLAQARGRFIAFIDADDLWAPTKIGAQLEALRQGGPGVGLAYCWYASIDQHDRVVSFGPQPLVEGNAMKSLCAANWIGNGSSLLLRRTAFDKAGGYDPTLRARGAQGAEDLLMCLRVAEHAGFAVVPRYLVGYRATPGNMSSDSLQMFRSTELVLEEYRRKYPEHADDIALHLRASRHWFAYRAAAMRRRHDARILLADALRHHPLASAWHFSGVALSIARGRLQRRFGRTAPWPLYTETIW
jgi:glycosyltransferase involved in cell wall biosynthesis